MDYYDLGFIKNLKSSIRAPEEKILLFGGACSKDPQKQKLFSIQIKHCLPSKANFHYFFHRQESFGRQISGGRLRNSYYIMN